eukprot:TRINITY_DN7359_c0_g1_i1.p1 TRINITY_DN7359_c0_g1~~TRINITY_DN7359_c0_g1_i1.p1  ORF type:complete len:189 (-),score=45.03 TRINITY_DN7359_c0_g1_i1:116-682(-)
MPEYKIALVGEEGAGKSSLAIRLLIDQFFHDYDLTVEDWFRKWVQIDGVSCLMDIFDSVGWSDIDPIRYRYIPQFSALGFIIVYSVTCRNSFAQTVACKDWILRMKGEERIPLVLVGSKCDLDSERTVSTEEGEKLAKSLGCPFFETSAKDKINIEECFLQLVREIQKDLQQKQRNGDERRRKSCVII